MNNDRVFTLLGKTTVAHDELLEWHQLTMGLLRDLSEGRTLPSQIQFTPMGWKVGPVPEEKEDAYEEPNAKKENPAAARTNGAISTEAERAGKV